MRGDFPAYGKPGGKSGFDSPDQIQYGSMLPKISVDQYAATLGAWFGVPAANMGLTCPNLANFSSKNVGFV
jgi:hypothetical protein